jgi:hypothetical protein
MGLPIGDPGLPVDPGDFGDPTLTYDMWAALDFLWTVLQQLGQWIVAILQTLVGLLVAIFRFILKFLKHIWENYVKAAIVGLYHEAIQFRDWLKRTLPKLIKHIQDYKDWYDKHILKQQLRLLYILQTMRRFLGILRLFHVKWAIALDNTLADIQNRIEEQIRIVRGIFNEIINTLAMVLDPTLLLKTNVLGASLLANVGAVKRIFGYGDNRIASGDEVATITKQHELYFVSTVQTHQQALIASGPTQDDLDNRTAARQALSDEINQPLPF